MINLPRDKKLHFIGGFLIALVVGSLCNSLWVALLASIVVGASKEGYDALGYGTVDLWDFIWTALGGLTYVAIFTIYSSVCTSGLCQ